MNLFRIRNAGYVIFAAGLVLWAYGFVFGTFFSDPDARTLLNPLRRMAMNALDRGLPPGFAEEFLGVVLAVVGLLLKIGSRRALRQP